eukprot:TRINITY_DN70644_c0_g1_i1.p1 TRINITY_DN70644_c0_g1~~TRINITY_DN70644_c0_g1_i1.p1  ORF type:complete len:690 (+),score=49.46 TRINITY_DN70644_c0_g1_i1:303-2372(+)
MVGSAAVDRYAPRRNDRVTYILRAPERHHRFGISALALGKQGLITAGRDGTVRSWSLPPINRLLNKSLSTSKPTIKANLTFDEHTDWVNDVLLLSDHDRIVSCSSDTTLKVWSASNSARSLRTLSNHTDYVKALAHVPNGVASGSLDARVLVWDLATGRVRVECTSQNEDNDHSGSVYCLAAAHDENILISGSTNRLISVWDIRTGDRIVSLRGHSDSVRCLAIKSDASQMLSGATDSTVRLWDMRMQRCIRSYDSPTGSSVWAIAPFPTFDKFVWGFRDGSVSITESSAHSNANMGSTVVPPAETDCRNNMVLDLKLSSCHSAVWVSTTGSSVRLWPLPSDVNRSRSNLANYVNDRRPTTRSEAAALFPRSETVYAPMYTIPGLPGIIAHRIMNDKRHVLTRNTDGEYCIWDITQGTLVKSLGVIQEDIDEVAKRNDQEVTVPSWFQVDIRLGSLSVRLDRNNVANAEIYAVDAGLEANSEDIKVNIGEHVLRGLFRKWLIEYKRVHPVDEDGGYLQGRSPPTQAQTAAASRVAELSEYNFPDHIPIIITEDRSPLPILRKTVSGFAGTEEESLPSWVVDLVRDGKSQVREAVKLSFTLEPAEGSTLPQLSPTSLHAARVLRVRKVISYIAKELRDLRSEQDIEIEPQDLEVLCNGQVLSPTMSLAAVRQFKWRSPEDLQLHFRLKKT